jgi:hypothetical protein
MSSAEILARLREGRSLLEIAHEIGDESMLSVEAVIARLLADCSEADRRAVTIAALARLAA